MSTSWAPERTRPHRRVRSYQVREFPNQFRFNQFLTKCPEKAGEPRSFAKIRVFPIAIYRMFMRRITHFPIIKGNSLFQISGFSGTLFSFIEDHYSPRPSRALPPKIRNAAERCANPYLLPAPSDETPADSSAPLHPDAGKLGTKFVEKLIRLSQRQFLCARLYASWRVPLFASAREATLFFRKHANGDQNELCLARALFAAKTSRRFAEEGAVVIGVFLPSRAMHAWVIEGDDAADPYDGSWINYQPIAMLS